MPSWAHLNDMVALFRKELELCGVREGETVAILSEMDTLADYAAAFMTAARDLGAHVFNVNLLPASTVAAGDKASNVGTNALAGNRPAIEALKSADLLVDLMFLLFSQEQLEIQKAGTRILLVVEPFEVLSRLFPTRELRARVECAEAKLRKAHQLRFTNPAGTDVTYELGQYPPMTEYGFTDTPGRWDHWPSGRIGGISGRCRHNLRSRTHRHFSLYRPIRRGAQGGFARLPVSWCEGAQSSPGLSVAR
jgi:2,5-dihydroxypyridine 5,6-dioxygenase